MSTITSTWRRIETELAGPLDPETRRNMRVEIISAAIYDLFMAALLFVPAVLTRLGGSPVLISVYLSLSYLGHVFSTAGLIFLRRVRPKTFAVVCWTVGRFAFVLMALAANSTTLLALSTVLWLMEIIPNSCLELSDPDHTQEYAAAQSTVIGIRGLVGPFLGVGLLAIGLPRPIVFLISGGLVLTAALVVSRVPKAPRT